MPNLWCLGSLNERLIYMKAMKHANLNMNRYPGLKNSDVFYQMIDLDKGVYGHAFLVSLFIHVNNLLDDYAEICFGEGGFLIISEGGTGENRSYVTHLKVQGGYQNPDSSWICRQNCCNLF